MFSQKEAWQYSKLAQNLENFPFENLDDLRRRINTDNARVVVDGRAAMEWIQRQDLYSSRSQRFQDSFLGTLTFIMPICLIIYTIVTKTWFLLLGLPLLFIGLFFGRRIIESPMRFFFLILALILLSLGIFTNKVWLVVLTLSISLTMIIEHVCVGKAVKGMSQAALDHEDLFCILWNSNALSINMHTGAVYSVNGRMDGQETVWEPRNMVEPNDINFCNLATKKKTFKIPAVLMVGILIHLWAMGIAWVTGGLRSLLLTALLPGLSEIYWLIRLSITIGFFNTFNIGCILYFTAVISLMLKKSVVRAVSLVIIVFLARGLFYMFFIGDAEKREIETYFEKLRDERTVIMEGKFSDVSLSNTTAHEQYMLFYEFAKDVVIQSQNIPTPEGKDLLQYHNRAIQIEKELVLKLEENMPLLKQLSEEDTRDILTESLLTFQEDTSELYQELVIPMLRKHDLEPESIYPPRGR